VLQLQINQLTQKINDFKPVVYDIHEESGD
jgi:hypothetical protein